MSLPKRLASAAIAVFAVPTATAASMAVGQTAAHATTAYLTLGNPSLNERSAPSTSAAVVGSLPYHSTIAIACQTTGSSVNGSAIWDKLSTGPFVSDYYVNTPNVGTYSPGLPQCTIGSPAPPPPARATGLTTSGNQGVQGQCTWFADYEFHAYSGLWPNFVWTVDNGNAEYWAQNAAHNGWTVTATPSVDSVAVFQPGQNGAGSVGHVAWVTSVSGGSITIYEMNGTLGPYQEDYRTIVPAAGVRYILAP